MRRTGLLGWWVAALLFAAPAVASAATITYSAGDHGAVIYAAGAGERLDTTVGYEPGCLTGYDCVTFYGDTVTSAPAQCAQESGGDWSCVLDADHSGVHVIGGAGADDVEMLDAGIGGFPAGTRYAIVVDGGDGNDHVVGGSAGETLNGGPGADAITGMGGGDTIDGGDGNDTLGGDSDDQHNDVAEGGDDVIRGGSGDDRLTGDATSRDAVVGHDVLDGGPGFDTVYDDWYRYDGSGDDQDPAPTVTLDGQADDGRPGENDDVLNVEAINTGYQPAAQTPATYAGSDSADRFTILFTNAVVHAGGGDDIVTGSDYADTIDGGVGDDQLSGGFGDDVIAGGPGQDDIGGDRTAACEYGPVYGICTIGSGNDMIYGQDGERDAIDCGPGADVAYVDAIDVTTGCETVHIAGSPPQVAPPATPTPTPTPTVPRPRLIVPRQHLAKVARQRALRVTCRLVAPGRCTVRATIAASAARKLHLKPRRTARTFTLGSARRTLARAGSARLRIKPARRIARALKHARSLRVTFAVTARYADGQTRTHTVRKTLRR